MHLKFAFYYSKLKVIITMRAPDVDTNPLEFQIQPILVDATFLAVSAVFIWITQHVMHSPPSVTVVRIRS